MTTPVLSGRDRNAVLIAGSANLDFVVQAPHIPAPGETVLGHGFQTFPGGKGANQAVACARAGGARTAMLLCLGDDAFAAPLKASLAGAGVERLLAPAEGQATGLAFICVDAQGENAITVAPGANGMLRAEHLPPLQHYSHLLLQLEIPIDTVAAYAQAGRAQGVAVVLNAAPAQALPPSLLALLDVLVVNEGELRAIAGSADPTADAMRGLGVATVIVTQGAQGSLTLHQGQLIETPSLQVPVVDTTGAGDTFCGVLVAALAQGLALPAALRRAHAAAALACSRRGAQTSIPTAADVDRMLARVQGDA